MGIAPFVIFPSVVPVLTAVSLIIILCFILYHYHKTTALHPPLVLFSLFLLLGFIISPFPDLSLPKVVGVVFGIAVFFYLSRQTENWLFLTQLLAIAGLGMILFGVLTVNWVAKIPFLQAIIVRLPETLIFLPSMASEGIQANQLAGTILLIAPLIFYLAWQTRSKIWFFVSVFIGFVFLLTQSRAGWIGALGGGVCALFWWSQAQPSKRYWLWGFAVFGTIGLLLGLRIAVLIWQNPYQQSVFGELSTVAFRQELWRWTLLAIADFPYTGVGFGAFRQVAPNLYPVPGSLNRDLSHAHNVFLQVAMDVGLIGLGAYVWLLTQCGRMGWHIWREGEADKRPFAFAILITLITFHFYGLGDTLALGSKTHVLFWGLLGLLTAVYQSTSQAPKP